MGPYIRPSWNWVPQDHPYCGVTDLIPLRHIGLFAGLKAPVLRKIRGVERDRT